MRLYWAFIAFCLCIVSAACDKGQPLSATAGALTFAGASALECDAKAFRCTLRWQRLSVQEKVQYAIFVRAKKDGRYDFQSPLAITDTNLYEITSPSPRQTQCYLVRIASASLAVDGNTAEKCDGLVREPFLGISRLTAGDDGTFTLSWPSLKGAADASFTIYGSKAPLIGVSGSGGGAIDYTSPLAVTKETKFTTRSYPLGERRCFAVKYNIGLVSEPANPVVKCNIERNEVVFGGIEEARAEGKGQVRVRWQRATDSRVSGYNVYMQTVQQAVAGASGDFKNAVASVSAAQNEFVVESLPHGARKRFGVRAFDAGRREDGNVKWIEVEVIDAEAPNHPGLRGSSLEVIGNRAFATLYWNFIGGNVDRYEIFAASGALDENEADVRARIDTEGTPVAVVTDSRTVSATVADLSDELQYAFALVPVSSEGRRSLGARKETLRVPDLGPPRFDGVESYVYENGRFTLTWKVPIGSVSNYRVFIQSWPEGSAPPPAPPSTENGAGQFFSPDSSNTALYRVVPVPLTKETPGRKGYRSYAFAGLAQKQVYRIFVRAVDFNNKSDSNSESVTLSLSDLTPPSFAGVRGFEASSASAAALSWNLASDLDTNGSVQSPQDELFYSVRVRRKTGVGYPTESEITDFTLTPVDGAATEVVNCEATPAACFVPGQRYLVRAKRVAGVLQVPAVSVGNLLSGRGYSALVKAYDPSGNPSTNTDWVSGRTLDTVAPVFAGVASSNFDATSKTFVLAWPAAQDDSSVARYLVYARASASATWSLLREVPATSTGAALGSADGLVPGTEYFFRVEAVDRATVPNVSTTPATAAAVLFPFQRASPFAGLASAALVDNSTGRLTWVVPLDAGITHFRVFKKVSTANCEQPITMAGQHPDVDPVCWTRLVEVPVPGALPASREMTYDAAGLAPLASHSFKIHSALVQGASDLEDVNGVVREVATADQGTPDAVSGLLISLSHPARAVTLSWTRSTDPSGISHYEVFARDVTAAQAFNLAQPTAIVAQPSAGNVSASLSGGFTNDRTYEFFVRAVDAQGNVSTPLMNMSDRVQIVFRPLNTPVIRGVRLESQAYPFLTGGVARCVVDAFDPDGDPLYSEFAFHNAKQTAARTTVTPGIPQASGTYTLVSFLDTMVASATDVLGDNLSCKARVRDTATGTWTAQVSSGVLTVADSAPQLRTASDALKAFVSGATGSTQSASVDLVDPDGAATLYKVKRMTQLLPGTLSGASNCQFSSGTASFLTYVSATKTHTASLSVTLPSAVPLAAPAADATCEAIYSVFHDANGNGSVDANESVLPAGIVMRTTVVNAAPAAPSLVLARAGGTPQDATCTVSNAGTIDADTGDTANLTFEWRKATGLAAAPAPAAVDAAYFAAAQPVDAGSVSIGASASQLAGASLRAGDFLLCKVTASDGRAGGTSSALSGIFVASRPVTLASTVSGAPSTSVSASMGQAMTPFVVTATAPDADAIAFTTSFGGQCPVIGRPLASVQTQSGTTRILTLDWTPPSNYVADSSPKACVVTVTATTLAGSVPVVLTSTVTNRAPSSALSALPIVSPSSGATNDAMLTCDTSALFDPDGQTVTPTSYVWQRFDGSSWVSILSGGAAVSTRTINLLAADIRHIPGTNVRCRVQATDGITSVFLNATAVSLVNRAPQASAAVVPALSRGEVPLLCDISASHDPDVVAPSPGTPESFTSVSYLWEVRPTAGVWASAGGNSSTLSATDIPDAAGEVRCTATIDDGTANHSAQGTATVTTFHTLSGSFVADNGLVPFDNATLASKLTVGGSGFDAPTFFVNVGGYDCPVVRGSSSATSLVCTLPSRPADAADLPVSVSVSSPGGATVTQAGAITYRARPQLSTVTPTRIRAGQAATTLTLSGAMFRYAGGGAQKPVVSVFAPGSSSAIACAAENKADGVYASFTCSLPSVVRGFGYSIMVRNADTQFSVLDPAFDASSDPAITSFSPSLARVGEAVHVVISGSGFLVGASASVGGIACASGTLVVTATRIDCDIASLQLVAGDNQSAVVTNPAPDSSSASRAGFVVLAAPDVTGVTLGGVAVTDLDTAGGQTIALAGTGFRAGTRVTLSVNGVERQCGLTAISATSASCITPLFNGELECNLAVTLALRNPDGQSDTFTGFTVGKNPILTSVSSPNADRWDASTSMTVSGRCLRNAASANATVSVGGQSCSVTGMAWNSGTGAWAATCTRPTWSTVNGGSGTTFSFATTATINSATSSSLNTTYKRPVVSAVVTTPSGTGTGVWSGVAADVVRVTLTEAKGTVPADFTVEVGGQNCALLAVAGSGTTRTLSCLAPSVASGATAISKVIDMDGAQSDASVGSWQVVAGVPVLNTSFVNSDTSVRNPGVGYVVHTIGDVTGDGVSDLGIGLQRSLSASSVELYNGATGTKICTITAGDSGGKFGWAMGGGTLVNDGTRLLRGVVVGEPFSGSGDDGRLYVYSVSGTTCTQVALSLFTNSRFGHSIAVGELASNLPGSEILVSAPSVDTGIGNMHGRVYVLKLIYTGNTLPYDFDILSSIDGANDDGTLGFAVGIAGTGTSGNFAVITEAFADFTTTGFPLKSGAMDDFAMRIHPVSAAGVLQASSYTCRKTSGDCAGATILGDGLPNSTHALMNFGRRIANLGDIDGDGRPDFAVGYPGAYVTGVTSAEAGRAIVFRKSGSGDSDWTPTVLTAFPYGATSFQDAAVRFGAALSSVGDVNGDGRPDFAIGLPGYRATAGDSADRGAFSVYSWVKTTPVDAGSLVRLGIYPNTATTGDRFGEGIAGGFDINGDGRADIAVGAPNHTEGTDIFSTGRGIIRVFASP